MTPNIQVTPEQLIEFSQRIERSRSRHDDLANATIRALREAGERRLQKDIELAKTKICK